MNKLYIYFLLFSINIFAQNKHLLYNFNGIPQAQLLNPSTEMPYRMHIGVPGLSHIYGSYGANNFVLEDLFMPDGIPFATKMSALIAKTKNTDFISLNQQLEILSFGIAKDDETYFSGGWYEEFDFISYMPKDILDLIYYGNHPYPNRIFKASDINLKMELLGVLHFGITKRVKDNLTLGARFKIYSSVANVTSTNNEGTLTTIDGTTNIYQHMLTDANISVKTAGFSTDKAPGLGSFLLGGSKGLGMDLGFTWRPEEQLTVTGSLQDFGAIFNGKDVKQYNVKGSYTFEGFNLLYPGTAPDDYWGELEDEVNDRIVSSESEEKYTSWRSAKVNTSIAYSFGKQKSKNCNCFVKDGGYTSEVGFQTYTIFRPKRPQYALTAYYKHRFGNFLTAKMAYTLDEYSASNLGLGLSFKMGPVNMYAMVDNMLGFQDLTKSKAISGMFGINIVLKRRDLY